MSLWDNISSCDAAYILWISVKKKLPYLFDYMSEFLLSRTTKNNQIQSYEILL